MKKIPNPIPTDTPKATGVRLVTSDHGKRGQKAMLHDYCAKWGLSVKYATKLAVAGAIPAECDKNTGTWWVRDTDNGPEVDLPIRPLYEGVEGFWDAPAVTGASFYPEMLQELKELTDAVTNAASIITQALAGTAGQIVSSRTEPKPEQLVLEKKPDLLCFVPMGGRIAPNGAYIRHEVKNRNTCGYSITFGTLITKTLSDTFGDACHVYLSGDGVHVTKPIPGVRARAIKRQGTSSGLLWIGAEAAARSFLPTIPADKKLVCDFRPSRDADGDLSYIFTPRRSGGAS